MKVLIVTETCPRYKEIADVSIPNLIEYAEKHGYSYHIIELAEDEGFHYKKHEYFKEAFKTDVDLILYKDIDSVFTNMGIPVDSFIDHNHDLFITKDLMGVNGGVLCIKNTIGGRWVNDFILSQKSYFNNEQEVMDAFIDVQEFNQYIKVLSHPSINSYPYSEYKEFSGITHEQGNWEEGDFVLHTPALEFSKRAKILKNVKINR